MISGIVALTVILGLFDGYSAEIIEVTEPEDIVSASRSNCVTHVYSIYDNTTSISAVLANEQLDEILSSSEYPAEDREWLESQLRTELAVRNGTFLSREGNLVELDLPLTRIENHYWGECVISVGSDYELTSDGYMLYDIQVYNMYGDIDASYNANINSMIASSTADLILTQDGGKDVVYPFGDTLLFTVQHSNGDNAVCEVTDPEMYSRNMSHAVSKDGSLIAYNLFKSNDNYSESYLYVCDDRLNLQAMIPVEGMINHITISSDNRYLGFSDSHNRLSGVIELATNHILFSRTVGKGTPRFSSNSTYCVLPGVFSSSENLVINLDTHTVRMLDSDQLAQNDIDYNGEWYISNDGNTVAIGNSLLSNNEIVYQSDERRQCIISPSGCFAVIESSTGCDTYSVVVINVAVDARL